MISMMRVFEGGISNFEIWLFGVSLYLQIIKLLAEVWEQLLETNGPRSLQFDRCLKLFFLKKFVFHGTIKQLKAELSISNNDSLHPFSFVSGLPVSVPCEITRHNIISKCKLWLRMSLDDDLVQYVFLDGKANQVYFSNVNEVNFIALQVKICSFNTYIL